jgi:DNA-binding XRE family transcriptional regulator
MSGDDGEPKRKRRSRAVPQAAQPPEQPSADELERARRLLEEEAERFRARSIEALIGAHATLGPAPPIKDVLATNTRIGRAAARLSQDELAAAAGLGRNQISAIERGANPTIETVERLAKALGATVAELLTPQPRRR